MSDFANRPAAEIAEERLELAAKAQTLRNEVLALEGDERISKGAELQETVERLETVDREYGLAASLENAEKMIKKLSQQPQRVTPVSYAGTVKYNTSSGLITDSIGNTGVGEDTDADQARMSHEYRKAFGELVKNRFDLSRVRSAEQRDVLERYGKGDGFHADEFFVPFRKDMTLGTTTNGSNAVPQDFRNDIITQRTITPVMASLVQTIQTNRTKVIYPRNADASATDQVGTGFANTKGEKPNTTLSNKNTGPFTQLSIDINTGTMWTAVTLDFLDDVPNAQAYLVNENSKAWAFYEILPELNHNAVVGYEFPNELAGQIVVVMLRSSLLNQRIQLRYEITVELLKRAGVSYETVDGTGGSPLSQMMSLVLFGDYTSYYLALLYRVDPSPVRAIDFLKKRLAEE